jgi:RNA polymerase sigma-70 factor (ECF subfamily)
MTQTFDIQLPKRFVDSPRVPEYSLGESSGGNKTVGGVVLTLGGQDKLARFEQVILPHLDAAYNLARWLTRNEDDARDMVQEASLRAFKFFDGFHGGDARAWLLATVRNTCYTWLQQNRRSRTTTVFDEEIHTVDEDAMNPSALALKSGDARLLRESLEQLPDEFREVIVLRDLEEMSYKEIADVIDAPLGTVMSRLARARGKLKEILCARLKEKA